MNVQPNPKPLFDSARSPRSTRRKLFLGLIAASAVLLILEGTARIVTAEQGGTRFQQINQIVVFLGTHESDLMLDFDPDRFWRLKPNIHIDDPGNTFWIGRVSNSLGYRNPEFTLTKSPHTTRIVCFGDSSTFGIGAAMADTWPSQLQEMLQHQATPEPGQNVRRYQVINAGVPGYTSYQGLQYMRQEIDRLQPDIVMASYANNDFWHWDQRTDSEHAARLNSSPKWKEFIRQSRLVQLIECGICRLQNASAAESAEQMNSPNQRWARAATQSYFEPVEDWTRRVPLDAFRENIHSMADLCEDRSLPLILVKWPDQPQTSGRWSPRIAYQQVLEEIAAQRDLQVSDVVRQFQDNRNWSVHTYVPNDIVHVNRSGNTLAAIAAADAVQRIEYAQSALTN